MESVLRTRYEIHFLQKEGSQWIRHIEKNDGKGFDIHEAMDRMRAISAEDSRSMGFEIRKISDD